MFFNSTRPKTSVFPSYAPKIHQPYFFVNFKKSKSRIFSTSVKLFCILVIVSFNANKVSAQLNLNFGTNATKISDTKYLYKSVNDTLDCIVTATIYNNAKLMSFDDNSGNNGGTIARFQPIITVAQNDNYTSYVKFNFQLIKKDSYNGSGGTNIVPSDPVWFRAYDIDGDGVSGGTQEFVEVSSVFTGSWVDAASQLITRASVGGGTAYTINNSTINGANISDDETLAFNGFIYSNTVSSWDIIGGSYVGNNVPDPGTGIDAGDRLNSWSFSYKEVTPGVDFGDAPASYNVPVGAAAGATIIPAYHLVTSDASNVKVYLGSAKPDLDYDPSGNINASVDDNNNATDDEDGFKGTYFPKYTAGSTTYSCNITATNTSSKDASLYGFIDFNGDGKFNPTTEVSSKVVVPANSGTKSYTVNFSFTLSAFNATSNSRYARFRISTANAEAAAPTGKSMDGEVEDYRFNTGLAIKGTVYDDNNGTTDNLINNVKGTVNGYLNDGSATPLYATLLDSTGKVLQSVLVPNNGAYTLDSAGTNGKFTVVLSTTKPAFGTIPVLTTLATLPTGFAYTSQGITSSTPAGDKSTKGYFSTPTVISDITTLDFGWNALPQTIDKSTTVSNPVANVKYPLTTAFAGTDNEDGSLGSGNSFIINTLPANVTLYYNNVLVTAGQKITNYSPSLLTVVFTKAVSSTTFTYSSVDASNTPDPIPAIYTIMSNSILPLNDIVLSANIQNGVVKLTLVAKDENNVAHYTWEQSTNGTTFTTIGSTAYQATNASSNIYSFSTTPTGAASVVYFRTVQYSLDGTKILSNTVAIKLNETASTQAMAMPTVIKDVTNIKISSVITQTINLNIVDNAGRMVMRKQATLYAGSNTFAVDGFDRLANGTYFIQIVGMDNQSVLRILVQH